MPFHAGLDWGGISHAVCVIDGTGQVVVCVEARHNVAGLADILAQLKRIGPPAELPIAIERPSGPIVDAAASGDPRADRRLVARAKSSVAEPPKGAAAIDSPIALAFSRHPTPASAARLGEKRMASFMAQHAYCGRRPPSELLARLHAAPAGLTADAEADAKSEFARALAGVLERLGAEIAKLTSRIEHTVAELPDGRIVMFFPRAGRICAAGILADLGDVRERFHTENQLAAEAGVCPVTHASGKSRGVVFRWACSHRLRHAVACADNSRHAPAWAAALYNQARARGCKHAHAVRILPRAWIRVLWRAWHNYQTYAPALHAGALKLTA